MSDLKFAHYCCVSRSKIQIQNLHLLLRTFGILDFCLSVGKANGWSGEGLWFGGGIMFKGSISAGLGSLTNVGFEGHSDIEACWSWAADIGHSDGGSGSFCGKSATYTAYTLLL